MTDTTEKPAEAGGASKQAARERARRWREDPANRQRDIENSRRWYAENRGRAAERDRQLLIANPDLAEARREQKRRKYQEDPEAARAQKRRWAKEHPEEFKEAKRRAYRANPKATEESNRRWREANPEQHRESKRESWRRWKARKIENWIEDVDRFVLYERDAGICGICREPVGRDKFDVDHIMPVSKGGEHSYANTQVAHGLCNRRKHAKVPEGVAA